MGIIQEIRSWLDEETIYLFHRKIRNFSFVWWVVRGAQTIMTVAFFWAFYVMIYLVSA